MLTKSWLRSLKWGCTTLAFGLASSHSWAAYPDKPVRLIVPFGAGGITDVIARTFAEGLSKQLGQPVIVDNRPGAGGNIAAEALARSEGDGYTLMLATMGLIAANPHTYKSIRFDPLTDFKFISSVADTPHAIVVDPQLNIQSLSQLTEAAKAEPEAISFATAGYGSSPYQGMIIYQDTAQLKFLHVPFKSGSEAVSNIIGGQINVTFEALPVVMPNAKAGRLAILALAAPQRHPALPELPTTAELGMPGLLSSSASGLVGPASLPDALAEQINAAARKALESEDLKQKLFVQGSSVTPSTTQEYLELSRKESEKWQRLLENEPKI